MDNINIINNNNIHSGHALKSDDDDQMDMMMNGIFQMPNDNVLNSAELYQNPNHHHYMSSNYTNDNSYLPASASSMPPLIPAVHHPRRGFGDGDGCGNGSPSMAAMREMIFRIAVMQPVHIDPESIKAPKRRNVRISKDPQSVAARHRRERISERIRILQRLVPGGTKMDTASMLDEAIHYVKFLKTQVQSLETASSSSSSTSCSSSSSDSVPSIRSPPEIGFPVAMSTGAYMNPHHHKGFGSNIQLAQDVQHFGDMIID